MILTYAERIGDSVNIALMSNIEVSVAIVCASTPPLKPLIIRVFPGLVSDSPYCDEPGESVPGNWNYISANHQMDAHNTQSTNAQPE